MKDSQWINAGKSSDDMKALLNTFLYSDDKIYRITTGFYKKNYYGMDYLKRLADISRNDICDNASMIIYHKFTDKQIEDLKLLINENALWGPIYELSTNIKYLQDVNTDYKKLNKNQLAGLVGNISYNIIDDLKSGSGYNSIK